jgi:hypothetical protein
LIQNYEAIHYVLLRLQLFYYAWVFCILYTWARRWGPYIPNVHCKIHGRNLQISRPAIPCYVSKLHQFVLFVLETVIFLYQISHVCMLQHECMMHIQYFFFKKIHDILIWAQVYVIYQM